MCVHCGAGAAHEPMSSARPGGTTLALYHGACLHPASLPAACLPCRQWVSPAKPSHVRVPQPPAENGPYNLDSAGTLTESSYGWDNYHK